jgi:hypothetical protein
MEGKMETIKLDKKEGDYTVSEVVICPKTWEKLKKEGDKQLYKKFNKYADYTELRIYLNENEIDVEAHCIKDTEQKGEKE